MCGAPEYWICHTRLPQKGSRPFAKLPFFAIYPI